jgi:hypothetical protein
VTPAPIREKLLDAMGFASGTWSAWFRDLAKGLAYTAWSPALTGLVTVGIVAVSGRYARSGNVLTFEVQIAPASGGTAAAVLGSTYINNLPHLADRYGAAAVLDVVTRAPLGTALVTQGARTVHLPTWGASGNTIAVCGTVLVAG